MYVCMETTYEYNIFKMLLKLITEYSILAFILGLQWVAKMNFNATYIIGYLPYFIFYTYHA